MTTDDRLDRRAPVDDLGLAGKSGSEPVLVVEDLTVEFLTGDGWVTVVDQVSFDVGAGETVGLVGESGSGKSVTSLAVLGLVPRPPGRIAGGRILLEGEDLLSLPTRQLEDVRGRRVSMIFQEPMTSLNPAYTVGDQIAETMRRHLGVSRSEARRGAIEALESVHIPNAARRARAYPHEFSGGMRQRVMIAMSLCCQPSLLIADEPTTALDVTVQAQVLDLLREVQDRLGTAILFITHDLGVVADSCDRVAVMYAGQIVEQAPVVELFHRPSHPYTDGLLQSMPVLAPRSGALRSIRGRPPAPGAMPSGCRFHPRCPDVTPACVEHAPKLVALEAGRSTRCGRYDELDLGLLRADRNTAGGAGAEAPQGGVQR